MYLIKKHSKQIEKIRARHRSVVEQHWQNVSLTRITGRFGQGVGKDGTCIRMRWQMDEGEYRIHATSRN